MRPDTRPTRGAALADRVPATLTLEQRVQLATRCRDCDDIPKVEGAGAVVTDADGNRVQVMHNGVRVPADGYCGPWMTDLIRRCRGHHEPQEECQFNAIVQVLPPDATMIELGGNWAYYTAWFLKDAPGRRAVVLEPDPANRAVGQQTMALNRLHATFVAGFAGAETAAPAPFQTEQSGVLPLPCLSVPQLMAEHGIDRLDVLHCDTQGAELDVLDGCRALFQAGRVGWAVVSTHVPQISGDVLTHHRCLDLLRHEGASIVADHDPWESFSGDGLIVARFGAFPEGWHPVPMSVARRREVLFRDPCYDFAEAWSSRQDVSALLEDVVRGSFEKLLLRPISAEDLAHLTSILDQGTPFGAWLDIVLQSPEFQARRGQLSAAFWPDAAPAGGGLSADSPVSVSDAEQGLEGRPRSTASGLPDKPPSRNGDASQPADSHFVTPHTP